MSHLITASSARQPCDDRNHIHRGISPLSPSVGDFIFTAHYGHVSGISEDETTWVSKSRRLEESGIDDFCAIYDGEHHVPDDIVVSVVKPKTIARHDDKEEGVEQEGEEKHTRCFWFLWSFMCSWLCLLVLMLVGVVIALFVIASNNDVATIMFPQTPASAPQAPEHPKPLPTTAPWPSEALTVSPTSSVTSFPPRFPTVSPTPARIPTSIPTNRIMTSFPASSVSSPFPTPSLVATPLPTPFRTPSPTSHILVTSPPTPAPSPTKTTPTTSSGSSNTQDYTLVLSLGSNARGISWTLLDGTIGSTIREESYDSSFNNQKVEIEMTLIKRKDYELVVRDSGGLDDAGGPNHGYVQFFVGSGSSGTILVWSIEPGEAFSRKEYLFVG